LKIGFIWMLIFLSAALVTFLWLPRTVMVVCYFIFSAIVGFIAPFLFELLKNALETWEEHKAEKEWEAKKKEVGDIRKKK
jgi:hypothetical protein